jgi:hypothetical protein
MEFVLSKSSRGGDVLNYAGRSFNINKLKRVPSEDNDMSAEEKVYIAEGTVIEAAYVKWICTCRVSGCKGKVTVKERDDGTIEELNEILGIT